MYVESLKALRLVVLFMTGFDFKNPSVPRSDFIHFTIIDFQFNLIYNFSLGSRISRTECFVCGRALTKGNGKKKKMKR